ncbi:hypothetical protein CASFOL_033741 [Castilleja foliolosa]|uniref:Uncharacterized protein n=1 Tax=Castilleja foliolosa TaxID=1961234 RepID=A0ABD3C096_9LAMI
MFCQLLKLLICRVAATVKTEMMMVSLKHLLLRSFIYDSKSDSLSKKVGVSETTNHVAATTREIGAPIVPDSLPRKNFLGISKYFLGKLITEELTEEKGVVGKSRVGRLYRGIFSLGTFYRGITEEICPRSNVLNGLEIFLGRPRKSQVLGLPRDIFLA